MVSKIFTQSIPATLVTDEDFLEGKLGKLYERGYVTGMAFYELGGYVDKGKITTFSDSKNNFDAEHTVVYMREHVVKAPYGWNGHGFSGSSVSSGLIIAVPLDKPLGIYGELKLHQSIA